jgi:hypothetical protein
MLGNISSSSNEGLPRKLTAVGTVGEVGQLFTVYEKNWNCVDCNQENYAARPRCFRCKKSKPASANNYVIDPAFQALQAGQEIPWQEVIDPNTYQVYYYNKQTGVTQWDRPPELGQAPAATGWFGRGQAGSGASQIYAELHQFYLTRPARKQKEYVDPKKYHLEGAQEYNIWYGRYVGDLSDKMDKEPAADRCKLETDAGYTRADQINAKSSTSSDSSNKKNSHKRYFCLHFAHGVCAKGHECTYYHRIPLPEDDARTDELFDCFGRQRHAKHKDDMSGTGSFMKPCRTLFVGNLLKSKYDTPQALEDAIWRHFGEFGELECVNVIHRLSIAFPRYRLRTSAEFAKEAMHCQALDQGEVLSIRWAHDDPNPVARDSIQRADKDALAALLRAKGISITPAGFDYPTQYALPDSKRLRIEDGGAVVQQHPEIAYPDTDKQYQQYYEAMGMPQAAVNEDEQQEQQSEDVDTVVDAAAKQSALARLGLLGDITSSSSNAQQSSSSNAKKRPRDDEAQEAEADDDEEEFEEGGWDQFVDEGTGAAYYFNTATGESSWTEPEVYQKK